MELDAQETRIVQEAQRLIEVVGQAWIGPDQAMCAGDARHDLADVGVVRMKDHAALDGVLAHQPLKSVTVERHIEEREVADMHVGVEDHHCTLSCILPRLARAGVDEGARTYCRLYTEYTALGRSNAISQMWGMCCAG